MINKTKTKPKRTVRVFLCATFRVRGIAQYGEREVYIDRIRRPLDEWPENFIDSLDRIKEPRERNDWVQNMAIPNSSIKPKGREKAFNDRPYT